MSRATSPSKLTPAAVTVQTAAFIQSAESVRVAFYKVILLSDLSEITLHIRGGSLADVEGWFKGFIKTDFCLARANCWSGFPSERMHGHPYRLDSAKRATKFYGQCFFETHTIQEWGCAPSRRRYSYQRAQSAFDFPPIHEEEVVHPAADDDEKGSAEENEPTQIEEDKERTEMVSKEALLRVTGGQL
jgi:hypothetical protein